MKVGSRDINIKAFRLVNHEGELVLQRTQVVGQFLVCPGETATSIQQPEDGVGLVHCTPGLFAYKGGDLVIVILLLLQATGIYQYEVAVATFYKSILSIAGNTWTVRDKGVAGAGYTVKKSGFADIGTTNDGNYK